MNWRAICEEAAKAGAEVLRDLYDKPRDVQHKGRIDLVTDADKASEETVLKVLSEKAPGVKVLAEESGEHGTGDARFIVDPLDGTTNYAHGLPIFCCTVGVEVAGRIVAGCTVDPMRDEVYSAARGEGATLNGNRLRVSTRAKLEDGLFCTGFPYSNRERLPAMLQAFGKFTELGRGSRRLGSAALDLAYVAAGRLDGFWEVGLKPWDIAAGLLLVEEAGGVVTRFDGSAHALAGGEILAANAALHAQMVRVLTSPA